MKPKPRAEPRPAKAQRKPAHGNGKLNVGGTFPGGGRPPDAWKQMCRDLASNDDQIKLAHEVLKDKTHPAWLGAWKFVSAEGYGLPVQPTVVESIKRIEVVLIDERPQHIALPPIEPDLVEAIVEEDQ